MYLDQLNDKVQEVLKVVKAAGADPSETPVMIDTEEDADLEIRDIKAEEFPDDVETYRQHLRAGGKREYTVHISAGD
jgi:hypothetical protein